MEQFTLKHQAKIQATLGCFDRMLFRGYLPIQSGWAMAQFLNQKQVRFRNLKTFLTENAARVNQHAKALATKLGRPCQYLPVPTRKEELARQIAEKEGIEHGLVCVFSVLEPCRTFSFRFNKGRPFVQSSRRKCLFVYFYFMDRDFGLIHVKLQTWFPMQVQVYLNGHEWLARKLSSSHIAFKKQDNVFIWIEDPERAQKWADRFAGLDWPGILERYARRVNPLLHTLLAGYQHYWVTAQSEYSTDILFNSSSDLRDLFPRLLSHSTLCFGAREVMSFLGRKLHGKFLGEVVSDLKPASRDRRLPGARVKHRVKENWLKMYDKARFGSSGRDGHQLRRRIQSQEEGYPSRQARHGVGSDAQGRRLPLSLSGSLPPGKLPIPGRLGRRR
jgi:hypothetical protein